MKELYRKEISTPHGQKSISVLAGSVLEVEERVDVLTTSAFVGDYLPTRGSLYGALYEAGIDVCELSRSPLIDLRHPFGVWLSRETGREDIARVGCLEMSDYCGNLTLGGTLAVIRSYFAMLELASFSGVSVRTVALPLLGGGQQEISAALTLIPIINECLAFLRRNDSCERIIFVDVNESRAVIFADTLRGMYSLASEAEKGEREAPLAFISYSSKDKNIADNLCSKLESRGIRVWYAPRNVSGAYASSIMKAIKQATHFVIIVSQNSLASQQVLNEIDNAFKRLPELRFKPLLLDDVALSDDFSYYLSRQHWMDASVPPIEEKLEAFADSLLGDS